jgi:hypothetical protein
MNVDNAKDEFLRYLGTGIVRRSLEAPSTPRKALAAMVAYYRDVRADGCSLEERGDMLQVEWGLYRHRPCLVRGANFRFGIIRQLIADPGGEGNIYQLFLRMNFPPEDQLASFSKMTSEQKSNRWCRHPADIPRFESFVAQEGAFLAVADREPPEIWFDYNLI